MTSKKEKNPQIAFTVTKADKIGMEIDAQEVGESVGGIMSKLKIMYWKSYIAKQKAILSK